jgi:glycine/D-amino acid oxidase-like deaminating enzyme
MRSLWVDPDDQAYPRLEGNLTVDVAIVGGGLSGVGAAWELRESGLRVALLEERTLASGASGRNAGFLLAGPAMEYLRAVEASGAETVLEIWRFTERNNRAIGRIVQELRLECGYLRRGSMSLAVSEQEWERLRSGHTALRKVGIETCLVDRQDLPRPFDDAYLGGLYYPGNAEIQPAAFVRGVAGAVASRVQILERTCVEAVACSGSWILRTRSGVVQAESVILATNAYSPRLLPDLSIVPIRGQVLATVPLKPVVVPFPMYADFGYQYWRQTPDGRLVVGGWRNLHLAEETGSEETLHQGIQAELSRFAAWIAGHEMQVELRWAGIMGFTPDLLPLVGAVPGTQGLWMAAGYSGHGVAMAFSCGGCVAGSSTGQEGRIPECFNPERFAVPAGATVLA